MVVAEAVSLKRETESLLAAAQDQALRGNYRKVKLKASITPIQDVPEQIWDNNLTHLLSEFCKMAQTEHKGRHDRIATVVHWCLAKKYGLLHAEKWYDHKVEALSENEDVRLHWDLFKRMK